MLPCQTDAQLQGRANRSGCGRDGTKTRGNLETKRASSFLSVLFIFSLLSYSVEQWFSTREREAILPRVGHLTMSEDMF